MPTSPTESTVSIIQSRPDAGADLGGFVDLGCGSGSTGPSLSEGNISVFAGSSRGDLIYANRGNVTWTLDAVSSIDGLKVDGALYPSIVLDSSSNPHISYYDIVNNDLRYARKRNSNWEIETVDSRGNVGTFSSITLDSSMNPHISYLDDANRDLKYAQKSTGKWSVETVDGRGTIIRENSIALDSMGNPHVSYYDAVGPKLKYGKKVSGKWSINILGEGDNIHFHNSMALDLNDSPHISFYDPTQNALKHATIRI